MKRSTRHRVQRIWRRVGGALLGAVLAIIAVSPASAAIDGRLSVSAGGPGDLVTLTTDNAGDPNAYSFLSGSPLPVYLVGVENHRRDIARLGKETCGLSDQWSIGQLAWAGGVGRLTFRIPNAPPGEYFFLIDVGSASPTTPCWSMGPLTLLVRSATRTAGRPPGETAVQRADKLARLGALGLGAGAVLVLAVVAVLRLAGRNRR